MSLSDLTRGADDVSRRAFLGGAARGLLGVTTLPLLSPAARALTPIVAPRSGTARSVIYLYMSGGMSQLDTFDLKPGAATQGPTRALRTNVDGIHVSEHFPLLARMMDRVAVINSMQSTQGAHVQGRYFLHTSYELRGTIRHPSVGAWLSAMDGRANPTLPAHVAIGGDIYSASGGFLPSQHGPLPIGDPEAGLQNSTLPDRVSEETFQRRLGRVEEMNRAFAARHDQQAVHAYSEMYDQAVKLMRSRDLEAFDLEQEPEHVRGAYGEGSFAQGCLLARRLVENGVRFVEVVSGGWDTHNQNFDAMEEKCPPLDRALASLLADLEARGMLEETLVVLATEFGRTPDIVEERDGRNHYPKAFSCLMAGGGIRGGRRWGKTDATGHEVIENPVTVPDFNATIAHALGLPIEQIVKSPSGRPFTVAHKGKPVLGLFA